MQYKIDISGDKLLLVGSEGRGNDQTTPESVKDKINRGGEYSIRHTFHVTKPLLQEQSDEEISELIFLIGSKNSEGFFVIEKTILGVRFELWIHNSITNIPLKWFVGNRNVSIWGQVDKLNPPVDTPIKIGGAEENLSVETIDDLVSKMPSDRELKHYVSSRVFNVLAEFIDFEKDANNQFDNFVRKKITGNGQAVRQIENNSQIVSTISEWRLTEKQKFDEISKAFQKNLTEHGLGDENYWQKVIAELILVLYPKYLCFLETPIIPDSDLNTERKPDFLLITADGYVDVLEIKKPDVQLLAKSLYRDNHVPYRELSGAIMQVEKYIYHLNRWGKEGEKKLTNNNKDKLPDGLELKIANPQGMVIMGRSNCFNEQQKRDLEIIRHKYKSVIDFMTYDNLQTRLEMLVNYLNKQTAPSE